MLNKGLPKIPTESVVALGFFDGIHLGHQAVLNQAKIYSIKKNLPLRIVTFYPHPRNFIGHRHVIKYITTYIEKYQRLQQLFPECEVYFLRFNRLLRHTPPDHFLDTIQQWFKPVMVMAGENFRFGYKTQGDHQFLRSFFQKMKVETAIIPPVALNGTIISSTMIRHAIEKGDLIKANLALGYPFPIRGRIVKGKQLGSSIGFPTANLFPEASKILPPNGVYFGSIDWQKNHYPALVYIGTKPTVSQVRRIGVEVHIGHQLYPPLYQERVEVRLLHFWRLEKLFSSVQALKEQMTVDQAAFDAYLQHTQGMINYPSNVLKSEV